MTPAISKLLRVRSRWRRDVDSGRNSARAMAPAEVIEVEARNNLLRAVLSVKAVRKDWICNQYSVIINGRDNIRKLTDPL
jgi:hypothetical protein